MPCCGKPRKDFQNKINQVKSTKSPVVPPLISSFQTISRNERIKRRNERIRLRNERIRLRNERLPKKI